ncbi:MAG: InlB B-repeat-containing protein [Treponema sp.]|nr:InlB B-repeat-containing protein [Treponema sp.]
MKKGILSFLLAIGICFSFISCVQSLDPEVNKEQEKQEEPKPNPSPDDNPQLQEGLYLYNNEMNPSYDSRTKALDSIFNPDELGEMVLVIDRSEWNKHLEYCDIDIEHEESVIAKGFYFAKDSKQWFFKDVGFRIRGNTSRRKPQDSAGNYIQSHFALDFEEWLTDEDKAANLDKKLAKSMRGVILKRFKDDSTYSREIYGYNLFRKNGIWIAPRASYTTLKIQIIDDLDLDKDGDKAEFETVNYGVYGMIEEIKKRFLAERTEKQGGGNFVGNNGNLWKCTWKGCKPNFVKKEANSIGEEKVEPVRDSSGKVVQFDKETFTYDYKGDKTFEEGKTQLLAFMEELNNLPNCNDGNNDEADIATIKDFYTNKMDGDLFLRTYAINVILGMNDDYWVNNNNFYFYFDEDGKGYFIPYDYDNILGVSCVGDFDVGTKNPMEWGSLTDGQHPLIQKILQVPEYMQAYKTYLDLYSNEQSYFDDDKSIAQITKWQSMIQNYINSPDLKYKDTTSSFEDKVADWCRDNCDVDYKIYTPSSLNYFTVRQKAIKAYLNPSSEKLTLTINAGEGTFESGNKTMTCEFKSLDTIKDIMKQNNIGIKQTDYANISYAYEKDGYYYYPDCFVDEKGNKVETSVALFDSIVLNVKYKKWIPVVLNFNGGMWNDESFINKYVMEGGNIGNDYIPYKEGYVFAGWTLTADKDDYVDTVGDKGITVYAKWISKSEIKPLYEYSQDNTKVTFILRPADFGYNWPSSANYTVRLMSSATGWSYNNDYHFTKQDDGSYTITLNYSEIRDDFGGWAGFKFYVKETDDWLGPNKYKAVIAPEQIIYGDNPNDPDFRFELLQPKLTLDLNGGNIGGSTDALSFLTNEIQGLSIGWIFEKYGYSNPKNEDLIFAGWTYTKDGQDFENNIPYGVATLYARWIEPVECVLTLNAGEYGYFEVWDEETSSNVQKITMDIAFTAGDTLLEVLNNNNVYIGGKVDSDGMYSFTGWYSYKDNLSEKDIIESETRLTSSLTLYPVMQYNKKVSVILDANGGSFFDSEQTKSLEGYENCGFEEPTREGYTFVTWAESKTGGNIVSYLTTEMEGKTLYARWIKDDNFFKDYRIIGDMGNYDIPLMPEEDGTVTYTFDYYNDYSQWGNGNGVLNFKLKVEKTWDNNYGYGPLSLGADYVQCDSDGKDISVKGLKEGTSYTITFKYEDESVWVKIAETSAE